MIIMPVIATYNDYVDELLRMSDLYRVIMKYALKEQLINRCEGGDLMNQELI